MSRQSAQHRRRPRFGPVLSGSAMPQNIRSPLYAQVRFGFLLSALISIWFAWELRTRYDAAIEDGKTKALNFAEVLSEHAALTFDIVERTLREAEKIRRESARSSGVDANASLRLLKKSAPLLVAIGWTDAQGNVLANSYEKPLPRPSISDMPHFIAQRDHPAGGLFISPPYRSAATNAWYMAASLRLSEPDGSFAGVVTAPIDQSYFATLFRSIDVGTEGSISLYHRAGALLLREPEVADVVGKSFMSGPLMTVHLPRAEAGAYETISPIDGSPRILGYKAVAKLPLVVVVTYAKADVLSRWYRHLVLSVPLIVAVLAAIVLGTLLLARRGKELAEKSESLERASRTFNEVNQQFEIALSNMPNGLCMFDAQQRLVIANERYQSMYGLKDEVVRSGTPLRKILETHVENGETSELDIEGFVEACMNRPTQTHLLQDGRTVFIRRKRIAQGGWIATHEDISELKRIESALSTKARELEANAAELRQMNLRFDAAINSMSHGVCLYDADQNIVVSNRRYAEIYKLSPEQVAPGTNLMQVLECRRRMGSNFAVAPEQYVRVNVKQSGETQELADGRTVSIVRRLMPDGGWLTTHEDITERATSERKIAYLAEHDLLTGLPNRAFFTNALEQPLRAGRDGSAGAFALFMLDLDRFKYVNDTLGHPAGDQLLVQVASRLKGTLREADVLARLGGDEFAIIQPTDRPEHEGAISLAIRIIDAITQPFDVDGNQVQIGTSIGIACMPEDGRDPTELLKKADLALYAAKAAGRNDYRLFQPEMMEIAEGQKTIESELRAAIGNGEFELFYQPIVDVSDNAIRSAEALVRWRHPQRGLIGPQEFIPIAESTGLIVPLGELILQQACRDASGWPEGVKLAVNVSAVQFKKGNLFDIVLCALVEAGLSPKQLELEITESTLLDADACHIQTIRQLRNIGIAIALDDFGTGYSSAAYAIRFPVDRLKIDQTFTQGAPHRKECAAVVASVLALARGLDLSVTAEGVETEEQLEVMRSLGVELAQGFYFAEPMTLASLVAERFSTSASAGADTSGASKRKSFRS